MSTTKTFDGRNRRGDVQMSHEEVDQFLGSCPNLMILVTFNSDGTAHAVPMGFAYIDGFVHLKSKARAQKTTNLKRNRHATCMIHDGTHYEEFRGVQCIGEIEVLSDSEIVEAVTRETMLRYTGDPTSRDMTAQAIKRLSENYVALRLIPSRIISWDHRKLSGP
jgi:nitroimidazol reductase NimA-like FMN-containing flavoprotein (pyridoxamine 5'-phosphate oxidase superfamily)